MNLLNFIVISCEMIASHLFCDNVWYLLITSSPLKEFS